MAKDDKQYEKRHDLWGQDRCEVNPTSTNCGINSSKSLNFS